MEKKICTQCNEEKPLSEYHKRNNSKTGYKPRCKKCRALNHKDYVKKYPERAKAINKKSVEKYVKSGGYAKWKNKNREKINISRKVWREKNPDRVRKYSENYRKNFKYENLSQSKFRAYIRNRKDLIPPICQLCGNEAKVQGHHFDYSLPLTVVWVCRFCHSKLHRNKLTLLPSYIKERIEHEKHERCMHPTKVYNKNWRRENVLV